MITNLLPGLTGPSNCSKRDFSASVWQQTNTDSRVTTWNKLLAEGLSYCSIPAGESASCLTDRLFRGFWKLFVNAWINVQWMKYGEGSTLERSFCVKKWCSPLHFSGSFLPGGDGPCLVRCAALSVPLAASGAASCCVHVLSEMSRASVMVNNTTLTFIRRTSHNRQNLFQPFFKI